MEIKRDGSGNSYIDVNNVRVTFVLCSDRSMSKDWAECHVLRIQAYRDGEGDSQALHMGAEFPVSGHKDICALLAAISHLVAKEMPG